MLGSDLLALAALIFQPVLIEAAVFIAVFSASLKIVQAIRAITNLTKGG